MRVRRTHTKLCHRKAAVGKLCLKGPYERLFYGQWATADANLSDLLRRLCYL